MKKFAIYLMLAAASFSFSCSDDDNDNDNDDLYLRFTENNVDYDFNDPATAASFNMSLNGQSGTGDNMRRMALFLPFNPTEGSHDVVDDIFDETAYGARYFIGDDDIMAAATDGTITITDVNDEFVTGTFAFTATDDSTGDTYTITDGSFRAFNLSDTEGRQMVMVTETADTE